MANPDRLSPAQQRALSRVRCEGLLRSGDGVTAPTILCLEREGLVRVTWIRRRVPVGYETGVWEVREQCDWLAEPVIDDYRVVLFHGGRKVPVTVYAAVGKAAALREAKRRFRERFCGSAHEPVDALEVEPLAALPGFLS